MGKLPTFFTGAIFGVAATFLSAGNHDLLSSDVGSVVSLKKDVDLVENEQVKVTLPKGTRLRFESQYDDVGEFSLEFILTDLSVVEESSGDVMYFSNQD